MRVALMSSSEISTYAVRLLYEQGLLVGIATCDRDYPENRAFKGFCDKAGLPFVSTSRKNQSALLAQWLQACDADVVLSISYRYLVPQAIIDMPPFGIYNFHNGKLPEHRGTDPGFWQIRNRMPCVYTVHKMEAQFDTGNILIEHEVEKVDNESYVALHRRLAHVATKLTDRTIKLLKTHKGFPPTVSQKTQNAGWLARPSIDDVTVDFSRHDAADVHAISLAAYPSFTGAATTFRRSRLFFVETSWTPHLKSGMLNLLKLQSEKSLKKLKPGELHLDHARQAMLVGCHNSQILEVKVVWFNFEIMSGYRFASQCGVVRGEILGAQSKPVSTEAVA